MYNDLIALIITIGFIYGCMEMVFSYIDYKRDLKSRMPERELYMDEQYNRE